MKKLIFSRCLFFTESSIIKVNLDGYTNTTVISLDAKDQIRNIAVDLYDDKLYWTKTLEKKIYYAELDGSNVRSLNIHSENNDGYLYLIGIVDKKYVYYYSTAGPGLFDGSDKILRANKLTGLIDNEFQLKYKNLAKALFMEYYFRPYEP